MGSGVARFEPDHCANCLEPLTDGSESLFCSELCMQLAESVRYWRRIWRDQRIHDPEVQYAVRIRVAHLLAGGYGKKARRLPESVRRQVWRSDGGRCRQCGRPGEEIDHIAGDLPLLENLQVLCSDCHRGKTAKQLVPATEIQQQWVEDLWRSRVEPRIPILRCDDEHRWRTEWQQLKKERRQRIRHRLLDDLEARGLDRAALQEVTLAELAYCLLDQMEQRGEPRDTRREAVLERLAFGEARGYRDRAEGDVGVDLQRPGSGVLQLVDGDWIDLGNADFDPGSDDSGYGPNSYFAHAMAKDD